MIYFILIPITLILLIKVINNTQDLNSLHRGIDIYIHTEYYPSDFACEEHLEALRYNCKGQFTKTLIYVILLCIDCIILLLSPFL